MQTLTEPAINPRGTTPADDRYLPARAVWERYGVTSMTLHRWVNTPHSDFPQPTYLGRFRYWKVSELVAWERSRPQRVRKAA